MLTKQLRELERQAQVIEKNQKTYWQERYENLPDYIVVGRDMDGVTGYTVINKKDEVEFYSGCYRGKIMNGLSMRKSEMQELADKMNNK